MREARLYIRTIAAALAVIGAVGASTLAAAPEAKAQSYVAGQCFYQEPSHDWNETGLYAANCLQRYSYWVNCCSSLRLVARLSDNAVRFQQRGGVEPYVDVDWDGAKKTGSTCCWYPAGYWVTIRR